MEIGATNSLGAMQIHRIYGAIRPVSGVPSLTAGQVRTPADPALAPRLGGADSLQLYGRAADRIEAATGVELGQILDRRA